MVKIIKKHQKNDETLQCRTIMERKRWNGLIKKTSKRAPKLITPKCGSGPTHIENFRALLARAG
jgi:hypothetical protein